MIDQKIQKAIEDLRAADASLAAVEQAIQAPRSYVANALQVFANLEAPLELTADNAMNVSEGALARQIGKLGTIGEKVNATKPAAKQAAK